MTDHLAPPNRADFRFWWPVTVRWGDMDAMGHVNNVIYFQYMESARIGYFEMLMGWTGRDEGGGRQGPVVVSQTFNYRVQVYYPAELEVGVRCREIRNRSFVLEYGIFRKGTDELVGDGSSVAVWLDYNTNKAIPIPPILRQAFTAN
ncbi:MAG: acyl-CoA thioesterase [Candidatus Methylomirabilales bacterium]